MSPGSKIMCRASLVQVSSKTFNASFCCSERGGILASGPELKRARDVTLFGSKRAQTRPFASFSMKIIADLYHCSWPSLTSPLRSKYQFGVTSVLITSGRSFCSVLNTWCVDTISDSPPSRALAMQSRPTRSAPSVWKYCLQAVSIAPLRLAKRSIDSLGIRSVDSNSILLGWVFTKIFHVSQDMPSTILTDKIAKVRSKPHICSLD